MPFATSRDSKIHYSVEETGPLVVLLHGLLSNAKSWKRWGFVDALADRYCVTCIDSLGHGQSDKPSDERLYGLKARSHDIVAVMDASGFEKAHVLGYSMGGWLSVGVAKYHPHRLSSLIVGGWDITWTWSLRRLTSRPTLHHPTAARDRNCLVAPRRVVRGGAFSWSGPSRLPA